MKNKKVLYKEKLAASENFMGLFFTAYDPFAQTMENIYK